MHAEIDPDTVTCSVVIIASSGPEGRAGQCIQIPPCQSFGEARARQRNHATQNLGKGLFFLKPNIPHGQGAGDVGGAIKILPA